MNILFSILSDIVIYLVVVVPLLYVLGYRKSSRAFKIFTIYIVGIALIQIGMDVAVPHLTDSNLYFFVYYFVFQFITLSLFYRVLLNFRWILYIMIVCLLFFTYQYVDDPSMYFKYNPVGVIIGQGVIVIYSLLYFYKLLSEKGEFVIINSGIFFYLLSSMMIFASGNFALEPLISEQFGSILRNINNILYFIFQILIIIEWYRNYRVQPIKDL